MGYLVGNVVFAEIKFDFARYFSVYGTDYRTQCGIAQVVFQAAAVDGGMDSAALPALARLTVRLLIHCLSLTLFSAE
ncbi:hypothetical protein NM61106_0539, partial [Neisseria meningitidis 61106]